MNVGTETDVVVVVAGVGAGARPSPARNRARLDFVMPPTMAKFKLKTLTKGFEPTTSFWKFNKDVSESRFHVTKKYNQIS